MGAEERVAMEVVERALVELCELARIRSVLEEALVVLQSLHAHSPEAGPTLALVQGQGVNDA